MSIRKEAISLATMFSLVAGTINASGQVGNNGPHGASSDSFGSTVDWAEDAIVVNGQTVGRIRIPFVATVRAETSFVETGCFFGSAKIQTPDRAAPTVLGSNVDSKSSINEAFSLVRAFNGSKSAVCFQRNAVTVDSSSLPTGGEIGINDNDIIQRAHVRFTNWRKLSR